MMSIFFSSVILFIKIKLLAVKFFSLQFNNRKSKLVSCSNYLTGNHRDVDLTVFVIVHSLFVNICALYCIVISSFKSNCDMIVMSYFWWKITGILFVFNFWNMQFLFKEKFIHFIYLQRTNWSQNSIFLPCYILCLHWWNFFLLKIRPKFDW